MQSIHIDSGKAKNTPHHSWAHRVASDNGEHQIDARHLMPEPDILIPNGIHFRLLVPTLSMCGYTYNLDEVRASGILDILSSGYERPAEQELMMFGASYPLRLHIKALRPGFVTLRERREWNSGESKDEGGNSFLIEIY